MRKTTLAIRVGPYVSQEPPTETTLSEISALGAALSAVAADLRAAVIEAESVTMTVGEFTFTIRVEAHHG